MTYTFDHMHLRVPDQEATAAWFQHVFGAEVKRSEQQGATRIDLKLGGANIFLAPFKPGQGVNANPANPYQGLDHFGMTVTDLDKTVAELKAKGVTFTVEPHQPRPNVRIAFLKTPDGVLIELLQRI